jgi:hypothetical protein
MVYRKDKPKERKKATDDWVRYFEDKNGRKPTDAEGIIFGTAFNAGFSAAMILKKDKLLGDLQ